jgi:hypothetical protein
MLAVVAAAIGAAAAAHNMQVAAVVPRLHQQEVMESSTHWLTQTMRQMVRFV